MLSLSQIDAAVRRVRYYNPDLELELLFLEESELDEENVANLAHIRSALVARVADIVKQASTQSQALDAAVSTVELLISSYNGHGDRPGRGHKHALQAIRLLACVTKRFDAAVELFFDLVERFCAQSRGDGKIQGYTAAYSDAFAIRMMQNYDQTLVKLISRQWSKDGRANNWNVQKPIDRIKTLRKIYEFHNDNMSMLSVRSFRRRQPSSSLFSESLEVLRTIRKQTLGMGWLMWTKAMAGQLRFWSAKAPPFDPTQSSVSTASTFSDVDGLSISSTKPRRKFTPRDAEITDLKQQVDMLCAVIEKNAQAKVYNSKLSDMDTASNYTISDDTTSLRSHHMGGNKSYHAS